MATKFEVFKEVMNRNHKKGFSKRMFDTGELVVCSDENTAQALNEKFKTYRFITPNTFVGGGDLLIFDNSFLEAMIDEIEPEQKDNTKNQFYTTTNLPPIGSKPITRIEITNHNTIDELVQILVSNGYKVWTQTVNQPTGTGLLKTIKYVCYEEQ